MGRSLLLLAAWALVGSFANAEDSSDQPYIDRLKAHLNKKAAAEGPGEPARTLEAPDPYIQTLKKNQQPDTSSDGYTEKLRGRAGVRENSEGYTEKLRNQLTPKPDGGAIQAVLENRSALHQVKAGEIHHAVGFRVNAARSVNMGGDASVINGTFATYYNNGYTPELDFFWEYQPFHSEIFGNIGLITNISFAYANGQGKFPSSLSGKLTNPFGGGNFTLDSQTKLRFITVPFSIGAIYRFNLFQWVRPYASIEPTMANYGEFRDDNQKTKLGYSTGLMFTGGINFQLDQIFKDVAWDLYADYGIKKFYLTVDYSKLTTLAGSVTFDRSIVSVGMTYEY